MDKMATVKMEVTAPVNQKTYGKIHLTLSNCLLPLEKLQTTPSTLDGLDRVFETDLRILGCELIQTAGILLGLPQVAMATGQVLFQRFFYCKSFIKHNMEIVAMGCVCLASKIEEAPRRIRDVINVFHHIKQVRNKRTIQPLILDQNYINLKNQVIKAERRVLKELGFCVHVRHPHKFCFTSDHSDVSASPGMREKPSADADFMDYWCIELDCHRCIQSGVAIVDTSDKKTLAIPGLKWNYMNDSLRTDVFLQYQPETVACACIFLSARQLKIPLPNKPAWYLIFGVAEDDVQDICFTILRLYTRKKPDGEKLEKIVEDLRKLQLEAKMKAKNLSGNNTPQPGGFSPNSRPSTPKPEKSPLEIKKEKIKEDFRNNSDHSPRVNDTNHIKKHSRSPDSNKSGLDSRSSRSNSHSLSPKRKTRTPPRGYKEVRRSRSRSRSHSHERIKDHKHRSHKRRRSRSISRSFSRSPHRTISSKKSSGHHKDHRSRYKSRSRSRDRERERERERNHKSRSRSRSYEKYKSRKDRQNARDNGHHRSRSRERSRR